MQAAEEESPSPPLSPLPSHSFSPWWYRNLITQRTMRYGVVQVQVQVDLQVGQRPAETFFQIRGMEREWRRCWRTRRKRNERASGRKGGRSERRARGTRGTRAGGRRSRTHFANSLARCFSGLHFANRPGTTAFKSPPELGRLENEIFSVLRAMNDNSPKSNPWIFLFFLRFSSSFDFPPRFSRPIEGTALARVAPRVGYSSEDIRT